MLTITHFTSTFPPLAGVSQLVATGVDTTGNDMTHQSTPVPSGHPRQRGTRTSTKAFTQTHTAAC